MKDALLLFWALWPFAFSVTVAIWGACLERRIDRLEKRIHAQGKQ